MKIQALLMMRWNNDTPEPVILDAAYNLAEYNFFQKGSVKEFLSFAAKMVMQRIGSGVQAVDYEGNLVYGNVQGDGLGCIAITDKDYPARVTVTLLKELLTSFKSIHAVTWRSCKEDNGCKFPRLEEALKEYQEPAKVDKILKLNTQLTETKDLLVKTIDKVLERGEKLDDLVEKSNTLSQQSKMFYKQAKKTNSCCIIM